MSRRLASLLIAAGLVLMGSSAAQAQSQRPSEVLLRGQSAQVTRVISGDTIEVITSEGKPLTVRYIGVAAPALEACYGAASRSANAALVQGKRVILEQDTTDQLEDGVAPRYVYLINGRMVNMLLAEQGAVVAQVRLPDTRYQRAIEQASTSAEQVRRGGWARCGWQAQARLVSPGQCVAIALAELERRVERPAPLGALRDGDCVVVPDAPGAATRFDYHPAGSVVTLGEGLLRWKDGVVLIEQRAEDGVLVAHVSEWRRKPPVKVTLGSVTFTIPSRERELFQAVLPLERDPVYPEIVRLPIVGTWVMRERPGGRFEALVDFFEAR